MREEVMTKSFTFAAGIVAALALASPALAERGAQPNERGVRPVERNALPAFRLNPVNSLARPGHIRMNPLLQEAQASWD
jgi:hypothetical protein